MGEHKKRTGKTRVGMFFKKVTTSPIIKTVALGALDFIPAGEPIKNLIKKTKQDDPTTNKDNIARIVVAVVIGLVVLGVVTGKISVESSTKIIEAIGTFN